MTDSIDDSDGSDSMHTDTVGDSATAVGARGIDNADVRISLRISDIPAAGMLNRVGMQTETVADSALVAGAVDVDQLTGMAVEDGPFAGLGSPCAETGGIVGPGGLLRWLPLGDRAALAGYRRVVQPLPRAVPSRGSALISYDCS